jgi:hypothetical protein
MDKFGMLGLTEGLTSQLATMARLQKNHFGAIDTLSSFAKNLSGLDNFTRSYTGLGPFDSMMKQMANHQKMKGQTAWINNPLSSIADRLKVITQPQIALFDKLNTFGRAFSSYDKIRQINGLQFALGGISAQITRDSILNKKWNLLENFEEITEEVSAINDRVIEQQQITKQDIDELKNIIRGIDLKLENRDKNFLSKVVIWITILSFIWDAFSFAERFIKEDDHVTKMEFEEFKCDLLNEIKKNNENEKDVRRVGRQCNLRAKPNTKSWVLKVLTVDTEVIVLSTNNKWVQVSMIDTDNTVIYGWVYKKYLEK